MSSSKAKQWFRQLLSAVIRGGSHAGSAYLGLLVGHSVIPEIPVLNLKGLVVIVFTSAMVSLFRFLQDNPIPDDEEVTQAMAVIQKKVDAASKIYVPGISPERREQVTSVENGNVYSRPECIFHYCSTPKECKENNKCRSPR